MIFKGCEFQSNTVGVNKRHPGDETIASAIAFVYLPSRSSTSASACFNGKSFCLHNDERPTDLVPAGQDGNVLVLACWTIVCQQDRKQARRLAGQFANKNEIKCESLLLFGFPFCTL